VGDWVTLAGQVGVRDHVSVGDRVRAAAQTGIAGDIAPGQDISGFPARPNRDFLRSQAVLHRLVPLARRLEDLARETDPNG
jgi:UDP-3-O-[3-hydroxymyristoyl] glucosamine N-acyltransferase